MEQKNVMYSRLIFIRCRISCNLSLHWRYKYCTIWQAISHTTTTESNDGSIRQFSCVPLTALIACVMLHRKVVHFVRILWDLSLLLAGIRRIFSQCKYINFQRDPLSVKARRISTNFKCQYFSYGQFSKHVCFLSLIWPNSFRNYLINRLKTTKYRRISCIGVYRRIVKEFFMSLMSKCQNMPKYRFLKKSPKISIPNFNKILFTYLHRQ